MATQKEDQKLVFKTDFRLMQVKSIAGEHSTLLSTFIKLPFVIKTFVTCVALAKAGLVVGPLRPSVRSFVCPQQFRVPRLCNL